MKHCKKCGKLIPEARLKALPTATTCVDCSSTQKVAGFRIITGKNTYTELEIVSQELYRDLTRKQERKGQSPVNGIKKPLLKK